MPETIKYVLYDTAEFGASAGVDHELFQVAEGADSTHVEHFTNSRGAGALPPEESFLVEEIQVFPDPDLSQADAQLVWKDSFLEVKVGDRTYLKAPLQLFAASQGFQGHYTQGTAADANMTSMKGEGFKLDPAIEIPGGTKFRVRVYQGTALSGANKSVKVCLIGKLTRP